MTNEVAERRAAFQVKLSELTRVYQLGRGSIRVLNETQNAVDAYAQAEGRRQALAALEALGYYAPKHKHESLRARILAGEFAAKERGDYAQDKEEPVSDSKEGNR